MNNLEEIVQLVMRAYDNVHGEEYDIAPTFELELRKNLMQKYCASTQSKSTVRYSPMDVTFTPKVNEFTTKPTKDILYG